MNLYPRPPSASDFAPYGQLIAPDIGEIKKINAGICDRHHALARVQVDDDGYPGISIFRTQLLALPQPLVLLERHPLGSQAFMPLDPAAKFIAVVCNAENPQPDDVQAFALAGGRGINLQPGIWHAPLMAISGNGDFLVVDRIGSSDNLEEISMAESGIVISSEDSG